MNEEKVYSSYEMTKGKDSYEWCLEQAGATIHAFNSFGSYQGDWLAKVTYDGRTGWIMDSYGSCSGCDAFESESGYIDRTKESWKQFCVRFSKDYLEDLMGYDEVLAKVAKHTEWDLDAIEMKEWLIENKDTLENK